LKQSLELCPPFPVFQVKRIETGKNMKHFSFVYFVPILSCAFILSACKTYAPEPLDLEGYGAAWKARPLAVTPVGEWVESESVSASEPDTALFELADGMALSEGEEILLRFSPALRVARAEAGIAEAQRDNAGLWGDPVLDALLGQKSPDDASDRMIFGAGMTLTLPLSGRPGAERALAVADADAALLGVMALEWQSRQDFALVWAAWSVQEEKRQILSESLASLEEMQTRTALLVEAGEIQSTEARVLEFDLVKTRNLLNNVAYEERQARIALFSMMGLHPENETALLPMISGADTAAAEISLEMLARSHPQVLQQEAEYIRAERVLALEIRKQYPDIQLSPSFEDEGDESRLALGLGIPTAVWNRNRQGIAVALAERNAARQRTDAAYEAGYAEIMDLRIAYEMARSERVSIETELAPLADQQLKELQTLLGLGEMNVLLLRQGLEDVLEAKMSWLAARLKEAEAGIRLHAIGQHAEAQEAEVEKEIEP